jgi:hypothetical protein
MRPSPLPRLIRENVAADFPIVKNKLSVSREGDFDLPGENALFDGGKEARVTLCNRLLHNRLRRAFSLHVSRISELNRDQGKRVSSKSLGNFDE